MGAITGWLFLLVPLQLLVLVRVILRPHREPASRIAWIAVVAALPVIGMIAYILLGEVRLGRKRVRRLQNAVAALPLLATGGDPAVLRPAIPERVQPLFAAGQSINGFPPLGGNSASLLPDSDATIDAMVADIDAAHEHVHLLFYIWLPDNNGVKVVEALKRAAARGVDLPRHGRRPGLARDDRLAALAGDAGRRRPPGPRAADRHPACRSRCAAASTCATTARSS